MTNSASSTDGENEAPKLEGTGLPARIERALADAVPRQKLTAVRQEIVSYVHAVAEYYSGPLPHPEHLEHFDRVLPGAADRILTMAEREQSHRHTWEQRELRSSILTERMGLFGGVLVAIGLIVGAVVCAVYGQTVIGGALVAASAVSMVPSIIKGRDWLNSREPTKKAVVPTKKPSPAKKRGR